MNRHHRKPPTPSPLALAVAVLLALPLAAPVFAQSDVSSAARAATRDYDLPAAPLATTLNRIARDAGLTLTLEAAMASGVSAPSVRGRMPPEEALKRALDGSGLELVRTNSGGYTLRHAVRSGADTRLPEVTVTTSAHPETAWGPVAGYSARRSATATKTDTPLIETPQSITVVSREFLRDHQVQNISEAMRYIAGASGGEDGRDGFSAIRLRGFAQSSYTMRDGTRQSPFNIVPQDPYGLERIEALKGPSSVLFGQSGPGGVINLITKRPTAERLREVNVGVGTHDFYQVSTDLGGAINEDGTLSYRLTARVLDRKDAVDYVGEERAFFAPAVSWKPNAQTSLTALAEYIDVEAVRINALPIQGTLRGNPNGRIPLSRFIGEPDFDLDDKKQWQLGYILEHRLDDRWAFRQNLRYTRFEADTHTTFSLGIQDNLRYLNRRPVRRLYDGEVFTVDNQLEAKWGSGRWEHTSLLGADYLRYNEDQVRYNGTVAPLDLFNPVYGSPVTFSGTAAIDNSRALKQFGVYAQHQAKFDDRWVLLLGGRHDRAKDTTNNHLTQASSTRDDNAFTGRAGLAYLFPNGFAPYLSYSESFNPIGGSDASGNPFDPETGEQKEIGLKYESPSKRWSGNLAFYDLRRLNVPTTDPDDSSNRIQVGEQTHRGAELELRGDITRRLSVIAALSYLDAEITRDNTLDSSGNKRLEGKTPTRIPKRMVSLWAKYELPQMVIPGLSVGLGARYVGGIRANADNTARVPSYLVWDAGVYIDRPDYTFSITAKNLFDRDYYAAGTSDANVVSGDPLTVVANIAFRW